MPSEGERFELVVEVAAGVADVDHLEVFGELGVRNHELAVIRFRW